MRRALDVTLIAIVIGLSAMISLELFASSSAPGAGASRSSAARAAVETKASDPSPLSAPASSVLTGQATWFQAPSGTAAAGPALRRLIGSSAWRGTAVDVCRQGATFITCVRVRLTDWCACSGERIIDLSDDDFAALAPLSKGVIRVRVAIGAPPRETITQPPTDTIR